MRQSFKPTLIYLALSAATSFLIGNSLVSHAAEQTQQISTQNFNIAPGPLGQVLTRFSDQSGLRLIVASELLAGHQSPGLKGQYSIQQGLQQLLADTGLVGTLTGDTLLIEQVSDLGDPLSLDMMRVEDNQLGTISEKTKSYTPGTIATSTRLVLTPRETPQTVTVITRQHMDDFNLTDIDKVMQHTPGITVNTLDSERTQYYARGFPITTYQYDGIPIQRNAAYASGNNLSDMIIYDRVEILKGATGLTTGAGTPGATLNLIRKKPTYELSGHMTAEAGSWDNYRTEVDIGGPLNESGSIRGRFASAFQDKHSYLDHYKRQNKAYYGIMEFDLSPATLLTAGFDYNKSIPTGSSWGGIPILDSKGNEVEVSRSFNPGASWASWEQYSHSFFTQLDHQFDNGWTGRAYYTFQVNGYDAQLGSAFGSPDVDNDNSSYLIAGRYRGKTKSHSGEIYASGPFQLLGREHELVLGASLYRNHWKGKSFNYSSEGIGNYYQWNGESNKPDWGSVQSRNDELTLQKAVYATARFKPTDDLSLILGSRITNYHLSRDYHSRSTGEVTPYVGVIYDLNDTYSLYASYTSIFMPSTYKDKNGSLLEPNEGDSYEAGIKGEWFNGRLNASLAYFEIREDDRAEYVDYNYETNESIYEAMKAKTKGIELEMTGELAPGWNIQTGYTYKIIKRDRDNKKLSTDEPEHLFKVFTTYRLPGAWNKLMVGGGAEYHGSTWSEISNPAKDWATEQYSQEAYWLANLMAKYQFTDKLSTTLNINNLFDKYYYTNINFYANKAYGEKRNMMLTTRWDF